MRKRITNQDPQNVSPVDQSWLDLQRLAQVELTSEDAAYPIDAALIPSADRAGGRHKPGSRRSAFCLTSRRGSGIFTYCFRKINRRARKSSCCGGRRTAVNLTGRFCVSNTLSARRA